MMSAKERSHVDRLLSDSRHFSKQPPTASAALRIAKAYAYELNEQTGDPICDGRTEASFFLEELLYKVK